MGYYSEVGLGMFKEDFERLIKKTKYHKADENDKIDAYNCLTKYCDDYYSDSFKQMDWAATPPKEIGPKQKIVILYWHYIKLYGIGMKYIKEFLTTEAKNSSCLTWVGENIDDVGFEEYNSEENEICWHDFLEPVSSISIETRGINSPNYEDFLEELEESKK